MFGTLITKIQGLTEGKKTYGAAVALVALAAIAAYTGEIQRSGELLAAALAAVGLRSAVKPATSPS